MGYFHAWELLELAFLSSLTRKFILWEGFYHNCSTKKVSASGSFAPWPPPRGSAPWTPEGGTFTPSNNLSWHPPTPVSCRGIWGQLPHPSLFCFVLFFARACPSIQVIRSVFPKVDETKWCIWFTVHLQIDELCEREREHKLDALWEGLGPNFGVFPFL